MPFTLPGEAVRNCDGFNGLLYCFSRWAYNVTGGLFWTMLLLGFCVAIYMATVNTFRSVRAFGFATVTGALGAIWLGTLQLMPWWTASAFILSGAIGLATMIISEK